MKQLLPSEWTLSHAGLPADAPTSIHGREIKALVPGCVHTDLIAAGLIDDPYFDRNELKQTFIGRTAWRYTCQFIPVPALLSEERVELVCDGLDTIATLELNGTALGNSSDMHLQYRFDAKSLLREGTNELAITFASPLVYAEAMRDALGDLPHVEKHPFNFIRKMACNFGWDWGPALITAGIWQPIYLEGWSGARFVSVRPSVVRADTALAEIEVAFEIEYANRGKPCELEVRAEFPAVHEQASSKGALILNKAKKGSIRLSIEKPELWWPRGHGAQPLYEIDVFLSAHGTPIPSLDRWTHNIGLRTTRLNTDADAIGSQFTLEVNGKPIFCKGANWIPDDCFLNRVDAARYRRRIEQAADANMNMLRIWGGGIFETDTFYTICDELGIMVWQDFLFACAAYPEEEPFQKLVEAEARYNIARLALHPSLVIWNGCNENIWGYADWGWKDKIGARTWGMGYYLDLLPKLVKELDPARPYWPGSPYSGSMDIHPLDDKHGNKHIWDAWNQKDYTVYRDYTPRFCSEFGHQAPPTYATLRSAIPSRQLEPASAAMLHHQKAPGGNDKLHSRLTEHFALPEKFDEWLFVTQLNQARALQVGVEWLRSRQPVCMGALYWQHNDCWPVTSWAAVDGEGRKKPLWYATRKFFNGTLLCIQPETDGTLALYAVNDTDSEWSGMLTVQTLRLDGASAPAPTGESMSIPPRGIKKLRTVPSASTEEFIFAALGSQRAFWFFDIDKNLRYPEPQFDGDVEVQGTRYSVTIIAKTLLRDLSLFVDRLDPASEADDQLVTLLPGEAHTFVFESTRQFSPAAILRPPVLQCANNFGARSANS